jgi:hypothetical protein
MTMEGPLLAFISVDVTPGSVRVMPNTRQTIALAISGIVVVTTTVLLLVAELTRSTWLAVLIAASLASAVFVISLPKEWRARSSLLATAFVAALGVISVLIGDSTQTTTTSSTVSPRSSKDTSASPVTPPTSSKEVNARYLATLIREGPFTETLPYDASVTKIGDVQLSALSAASRIDAVEIETDATDLSIYAIVETYPSPEDAEVRASADRSSLEEQYGDGDKAEVFGNTFCLWTDYADGVFFCGGNRGNVFVEVTVSPANISTRASAASALDAILNYTDKMATLSMG